VGVGDYKNTKAGLQLGEFLFKFDQVKISEISLLISVAARPAA
jgi:hypothetical protein